MPSRMFSVRINESVSVDPDDDFLCSGEFLVSPEAVAAVMQVIAEDITIHQTHKAGKLVHPDD